MFAVILDISSEIPVVRFAKALLFPVKLDTPSEIPAVRFAKAVLLNWVLFPVNYSSSLAVPIVVFFSEFPIVAFEVILLPVVKF
jgi:hypothetical protein